MSTQAFWRMVCTDQLHLSLKEKCVTALTCFAAIMITGFVSHIFAQNQLPWLIASMGASAIILYVLPNSPLAQPWPLVMGHLSSACIGISAFYSISSTLYAAATALGLAVFFMLLLKCVHPPGAATALAPVLSVDPSKSIDFMFVLMPVGINVMIMLVLAIVFNRYLLKRSYPVFNPPLAAKMPLMSTAKLKKNRFTDMYQQDLLTALSNFEGVIDVSYHDLSKLFAAVHLLGYQRSHAQLTCGDIMLRDIIMLDYDTDVEAAWALMHAQHLKAMPVLDKAKHVIGIVTAYDFLKFIKLTPYRDFQKRLLDFIHKTPDLSTTKPEAIGHIMTRAVAKLAQSASIIEALHLMTTQGHYAIPIIDEQQHFVGMVFQRDVMAALLNKALMQR